MRKGLILITGLLLVTSCVNYPKKHKGEKINDLLPVPWKECKNPRPQMCPMIYAPVCGVETKKTYSNSCVACSDINVKMYTKGACK